eukprot:gene6706-8305_t
MKDYSGSHLGALDKWAITKLSLVCRRWFEFVDRNLFTYSHLLSHNLPSYDVQVDRDDYFPHLLKILDNDTSPLKYTLANPTALDVLQPRDKHTMKRIFSLFVEGGKPIQNNDISYINAVHNLIERISDYPYLKSITFNSSSTLPFLLMFIRVGGELYLKNKTVKFPSLKTITIINTEDEDEILHRLDEVEFLGATTLRMYNITDQDYLYGKKPKKELSLQPVSPTSSRLIKTIYNKYSEMVSWSIQNFPLLTKLRFECVPSLQQFIIILTKLKHLKKLYLLFFHENKNSPEIYDKWYNNNYITENPELVSDLIHQFNSNTSITSLELKMLPKDPNDSNNVFILWRMIFDQLFTNNHTISKFKITNECSHFLLSSNFYQSLLSSSLTSLTSPMPYEQESFSLLNEVIGNNNLVLALNVYADDLKATVYQFSGFQGDSLEISDNNCYNFRGGSIEIHGNNLCDVYQSQNCKGSFAGYSHNEYSTPPFQSVSCK